VLIGCVTVLLLVLVAWMAHIERASISTQLGMEGEQMKVNLDHIAAALVGLSELLGDADDMVREVSTIPTLGEMLQQMAMGFITQKLQSTAPVISPLLDPDLISNPFAPPEHAQTPIQSETENS